MTVRSTTRAEWGDAAPPAAAPSSWRIALLHRHLHGFAKGAVRVIDPEGGVRQFGDLGVTPAVMEIRDDRAIDLAWRRGSIGFAEGYLEGLWDSPDLYALLDVFLANEHAYEQRWNGSWPRRIADRLAHLFRANTKRGSKRNIAAHYDLGNAFYRAWLDPSMTYSAALFEDKNEPLEIAQKRKLDRLLDQLDLEPGMRLLEIGCGWGSLAIHAAKERGAQVTALTISEEQAALARARVREEGLEDRVEIRLEDYRDARGLYDRIVSIEMFEAVGEAYWPTFFASVDRLLAPGGKAAMQVITIEDAYFENYRRNPDFIQLYVFPGGMLPSPSALGGAIERAGFRPLDRFAFGEHYAETLARWARAFEEAWPSLEGMGGLDARFARLWRYYLAYCEAGFRHGAIDVEQLTLARAS